MNETFDPKSPVSPVTPDPATAAPDPAPCHRKPRLVPYGQLEPAGFLLGSPPNPPPRAPTVPTLSTPVEEAALRLLDEAVRGGRRVRLRIRGSCMAPLVRPGDHVEVTGASPVPGNLAVARTAAGELVCHRVLRRTPAGGYLLAGDRSPYGEEHAAASVLGVVDRIEHDGRRLRLDGMAGRLVDRALAWRVPGAPRRGWEALRRLLVRLRGLAWHFAAWSQG